MSRHKSIRTMIKQFMCGGLVWLGLAAGASAQTTIVEYVHTDALGSPVAVTDASGAVVPGQSQVYEPYGAPISHGPTDGPGFTGHVEDSATGLTYMQQRYYDASLAKFLSVDPVSAYEAGDIRMLNRYSYAFQNPMSYVDADGRAPEKCEGCSADRQSGQSEIKTMETVQATKPAASSTSMSASVTREVSKDIFRPTPPSFFQLTTIASLRKDMSSDQAVEAGELTRTVTLPAITVTAVPNAAALGASLWPVVPAGADASILLFKSRAVRETVYYTCVAIGVCNGTRPSMQRINQERSFQDAGRSSSKAGERPTTVGGSPRP